MKQIAAVINSKVEPDEEVHKANRTAAVALLHGPFGQG
jgi:hypothetical protein